MSRAELLGFSVGLLFASSFASTGAQEPANGDALTIRTAEGLEVVVNAPLSADAGAGVQGCQFVDYVSGTGDCNTVATDPGGASAGAGPVLSIVDTLGAATPSTQFVVFGSSGLAVSVQQFVGPRFSLAGRTRLTEIGGFLNNCTSIVGGVPQCPDTLPLVVDILPSVGGLPDDSTVIASFPLSHDDDPLVVSYESAAPGLDLAAGTYFATFRPQTAGEGGFLLGMALIPFDYLAGTPTLGVVLPGGPQLAQVPAAVRVLGIPFLEVGIDIRPDGFPNAVNPRALGVLPVAILGSAEFQIADIDVSSLRFGPGRALPVHDLADPFTFNDHLRDVNLDGHLDLVMHYRIRDTGIACGDDSATLTAQTSLGQPLEGVDSLVTVGCRSQRPVRRLDPSWLARPREDGPVALEGK